MTVLNQINLAKRETVLVYASRSLTHVCRPEFNEKEFFMLKLPQSKFRRNSMRSIYANDVLFFHLSKELLGFAPDGWRQSEIDFYFPSSDALCPSRTQLARRQPKTKASSWKERE